MSKYESMYFGLSIKLKVKLKNSITLEVRVHLWQRNTKKIGNKRKVGESMLNNDDLLLLTLRRLRIGTPALDF